MAEIKLTVRQIMNLGLWSKVCDYKGWDEWIYNEGRIDDNELVTFDDEFKKKSSYENSYSTSLYNLESLIEDTIELSCNEPYLTEKINKLGNFAKDKLKYEITLYSIEDYLDHVETVDKEKIREIISLGYQSKFPEFY